MNFYNDSAFHSLMTSDHPIAQVTARLSTDLGEWQITAYSHEGADYAPHLLLRHAGSSSSEAGVLVRIHSECLTGDLLGSTRCDCGEQLHAAMHQIAEEGGILLYLRQEGRGIGLIEKLKAYNLQDEGANTITANEILGHGADERGYALAIHMLQDQGVRVVRLLTNNPEKIDAFDGSGIEVVERIPIVIDPRDENEAYLRIKKDLMGHLLDGI